MITGFEQHTHELDSVEDSKVFDIAMYLEHNAKERPVTCGELSHISGLVQPRVRKIIHYIRTKRLIQNLIATNKGYIVVSDEKRIEKYLQSLDDRINSIINLYESYGKRWTRNDSHESGV